MSIFSARMPWLVAGGMRRGIGFRLLLSVVLFSTLVTLVLTALQLYIDYRHGVNVITSRLDQIERSYLGSLDEGLWNLDRRQVELQLEGILRIPDIRAAEVREVTSVADPLVVALGTRGDGETVARESPIVHVVQNQRRTIGHLYVEATLSDLHRELAARAATLLVSEAAKIFIVSLFILYIVYRVVTRPLATIAGSVGSYDVRRPSPRLELKRSKPAAPDELDQVIGSFNRLCVGLQTAYDELRKVNDRLEHDIAKRRRTEEALRISEARFRDFAETSSDWFWETGPDHRFTHISDRLNDHQVRGSSPIGQRRWESAIDLEEEPEKWRQHRLLLERRRSFRDFTYKFGREDGTAGFVSVSGKPVFDADGNFVGYRGGARDVTDAVNAGQALREAKDQAEAASRSKSMFLANMSHELRTPLNAVIGFSEMIESEMLGPVGNETYRNYAADIHTSGRHLLGIINEILDLAKVEAGRAELKEAEVDLDDTAAEVARIARRQADAADLTLVVEVAAGLPRIRADEQGIRRILFNLLSNAFKFTPRGGKVTLSIRQSPSRDIEIAVADTGIGIAAADLPKLTQPFVQLDNVYRRRYQGTGLGLSLVRSQAELHGGTITIASEEGVGTTVAVRLPASRIVRMAARASEGQV